VSETGLDHQVPMPEAPPPDSLPRADEIEPPSPGKLWKRQPVDMRYVDGPPWDRSPSPAGAAARQLVWIRADGTLPDDPVLHSCIVAYASDYTLLGASLVPHGVSYFRDDIMMASLDHAMWFHRPFRADEWLLYAQTSPSASGGRGLAYGGIFRQACPLPTDGSTSAPTP
jgi:acyl-CoA thioesterase-2